MTFYSIIYGLLFLGSTSALFTLFIEGKYEEFILAIILCLLIYCDTIYTSDFLERGGNHQYYRRGMKFIDLFCFLIVSALIIIICPESTFMLSIDISKSSALFITILESKLVWFFILLFIYCSLAIRWNEIALGQDYFYLLKRIFEPDHSNSINTTFGRFTSFVNRAYYHLLSLYFLISALLVFVGLYNYLFNIIPILLILFSILFDLVTPETN